MTDAIKATPLTVDEADTLRRGLPFDFPQMHRDRAELEVLRWIVRRMFAAHHRMANSQKFDVCLCSDCQQARPFIPVEEPQFCTELDEREAVS
jgi:hypothetical protein